MKATYALIAAAAIIHSAAHYERRHPTTGAEERASFRGTPTSADTAADGELIDKVILEGQAPRNHALNWPLIPSVRNHTAPQPQVKKSWSALKMPWLTWLFTFRKD